MGELDKYLVILFILPMRISSAVSAGPASSTLAIVATEQKQKSY